MDKCFDDGLTFIKSVERGKCFIEYIPAENAWVPIVAPGYMYIDCFWVSGSFKGHGYSNGSNGLLNKCIEDSKEQAQSVPRSCTSHALFKDGEFITNEQQNEKCSDGCLHCYIHKGDAKRNINTNDIVETKDFLIEEADCWREECWQMIKERTDCTFLFLTKRMERFMECVPDDWNDGYKNVVVCCTVENQKNADKKLSIFQHLPIKHKCITAQPLLEKIDIEKYLDNIELVVVGGESDYNAERIL